MAAQIATNEAVLTDDQLSHHSAASLNIALAAFVNDIG
jgi:hypothetical protein